MPEYMPCIKESGFENKKGMNCVRSEILLAMNIEITVFWIVTQCSLVDGCQRFGGTCCLHI
jgi:hypothetical protein